MSFPHCHPVVHALLVCLCSISCASPAVRSEPPPQVAEPATLPEAAPAPQDLRKAANLLEAGAEMADKGEYVAALQLYAVVAQLNPQHPDLVYYQGVAWGNLEEWDRALACFDEELTRDPDSIRSLGNRVWVLTSTWRFDEALVTLDRSLKVAGPNAIDLMNRGVIYLNSERPALALADFEAVAELEPESASAHYNRALALEDLGQKAQALRAYASAVSLGHVKALEASQRLLEDL